MLALWLADAPAEMLGIFKEVNPYLIYSIIDLPQLMDHCLILYVSKVCLNVVLSLFPEYVRIHNEIHVRISELPIQDSLRDLRYGLCKP